MNKWILFLLLMFLATNIRAQDSLRKDVSFGGIPEATYSSDYGYSIGGEVFIYDYSNKLPFRSFTRIRTVYKTIGTYDLAIIRDQVQTLGTNLRTKFDLYSSQNVGNYYLGDTESQPFSKTLFDSTDYYSFSSFGVDIGFSMRKPIVIGSGISRIDIKYGLRYVYEKPFDMELNSLLNTAEILGTDGASLTLIELGMVFENRSSEFRPTKGYFLEFGTRLSPSLLSTYQAIKNSINTRVFIPISNKPSITLASKLNIENSIGDVPYWFMPRLGGAYTIRGYLYRRFTSDNSISYSLELRSWLLKIPFQNMELGMNLFMDAGRVFNNDNWNSILLDHNRSFGFGGVMSIFTPDFILKCDVGFSEEGVGVYLGTGYSF